jgi:hypothetical protein
VANNDELGLGHLLEKSCDYLDVSAIKSRVDFIKHDYWLWRETMDG